MPFGLLTMTVGAPMVSGVVWPPNLATELRRAAEDALDQNANAMGSGFGGARNRLEPLRLNTIAKKGHGRQIDETGTMRNSLDVVVRGDEAFVMVGFDYEPADEWGYDTNTPKTAAEVASRLIRGDTDPTRKPTQAALVPRPFMGVTTGLVINAILEIAKAAAISLGGRLDPGGWIRMNGAIGRAAVSKGGGRGFIDPADGVYEVDVNPIRGGLNGMRRIA